MSATNWPPEAPANDAALVSVWLFEHMPAHDSRLRIVACASESTALRLATRSILEAVGDPRVAASVERSLHAGVWCTHDGHGWMIFELETLR